VVEATGRPRRKRLSWESRCEIVARIEAGVSPPPAAASGGLEPGDRLSVVAAVIRRMVGRRCAIGHRHRGGSRVGCQWRLSSGSSRRGYGRRMGPCGWRAWPRIRPSTIGKVLRRHGYSRLPMAEGAGARCARRYERERPGELLHIDTKRLGRTSVWGHDS
jgi:hypothetical protein